MPSPIPGRKSIHVPCEGELLVSIERYADQHDLALGRATLVLAEHGLDALAAPAPDGDEQAAAAMRADIVSLERVPIEWLTDEIARRLAAATSTELLDAAVARAEAAEGQVATMRELAAQLAAA